MDKRTRRRRLLAVAMLVDTLGGGLLTPFELVYALKIAHLSLALAGFVLSLAAGVGIAAGPLAGAAVDRFGSARVVAAGNVFGIAGCGSLLGWSNGWGYGIGAFFLGANMRVFWAAFTPLVAGVAGGGELEHWFGRLRAARYIGIVTGEAMSGLVLLAGLQTGLRLLVIADGLSFVAALILVMVAASGGGPVRALSADEVPRTGGYRQVLRDRLNLTLAALNVAATLLLIAPILVVPVFVLDRLHLPSWLPGLLSAVLTATAGTGLIFGARLVRGRRRLRNLEIAAVFWALGCATFLLALLGSATAYAGLFVGVVLLGFGEAMYAPTADALAVALAPVELRGRYAAVHQMAWGISETIAPAIAAAALAASNAVPWLMLTAIAAASAGAYRALERPATGRDGVAGAELTRR
jgi:MFS family permease